MKHFLAITGTLGIGACVATTPVTSVPTSADPYVVEVARQGIGMQLKDPYSAQFSQDRMYALSNGDYVICGLVNAKNSFGAYTGYSPYYVRMNAQMQIAKALADEYFAREGCKQAATGTVNVSS